MIDLRSLKQYALSSMPGSMFSRVITNQADQVSEQELKAMLPLLFTILKEESGETAPIQAQVPMKSFPSTVGTAKGVVNGDC